ncbi:MAG TPA: oligosaccharide flippase family protein [Gammaproteobacteria bacterium]|nr:oligosaccharide flippase family protein [Gammaproteobacteria bacterium]
MVSGGQGFRSLRARLISGGVWTFSGRVLTVVSGFAVNALIARMVSAEEVGAYFLLISVISVGVLIASLGLQVAVVRLVAQAMATQMSGVARATVIVVLRTGAVSAVIGSLVIGLSGDIIAYHVFNAPQMVGVIWFAAALMLVRVPLGLLAESFRGFHAFGMAALFSNNTITNVLMVILLAATMFIGMDSDLEKVLIISVISAVVSVLLAAVSMRKRLQGLNDTEYVPMKSVLDAGLPLMLSGVAVFVLTQADIWIIGMFTSTQEVAVYGAAIRMSQLIFMPLLIGNTMLAPFIAELYTQGKLEKLESIIRSASTVSAVFALFMLVVFVAAGDSILALAFGEHYRSAYHLLVIISAGQCLNVWCGAGFVTLINTGNQKLVMYISFAFGGLMIAGSLMMVGPLGVSGVALMMAFVVGSQAIFTMYVVKRKVGLWTHAGIQYFSLIASRITR